MIVLHLPSWFPHREKPLDGNFILRQIATMSERTTSIVMRHVESDFAETCADLLDSSIIFKPISTLPGTSKVKLFKAYDTAFKQVVQEYGLPDVIHLHVALPLGAIAVYLSRKYHIPLVVSEHWSIYQPQNREKLTHSQRLQLKIVYGNAKLLTTVSENLHQNIIETVAAAKKVRYHPISNVVDTRIFKFGGQQKINEKKQILHVSTLDNDAKNIMGILRVVRTLSQQRNDFQLNIIHDLRNKKVEEFIFHSQLESIVKLLGKKSEIEVAEAICDCDFMLQFSNYENQPCVLLESFCCGRPVIATTVGGIPEIANQQNSRLIEPRNEEKLLEALGYMIDHCGEFDPTHISNEAAGKYGVEVIGRQFVEAYREVLEKTPVKK